MHRKHLSIGLFGFGCVGLGLYEVLAQTPALEASIKRICVKNPAKLRPIGKEHFTYNRFDILNDDNINVVVELIDDAQAAFEIVAEAMRKGKAVVTANKKMIAEHLEELLQLQRIYNVPLLYEASCCASIPIIRNLEEYYDSDLLESLEGIVNGSTNYILTKIALEKLPYLQVLQQAQQLGYAESDPRLDTEGFDAKYKLQILVAHAFGVLTQPTDIVNLGIERLPDIAIKYASEKGYSIKLIAHAEKSQFGGIDAFVVPRFVEQHDSLHAVNDVFNAIKTKSAFSDVQFFMGKGAGAYPTASAVLSDISALRYDYRYEYKKFPSPENITAPSTIVLRGFLAFPTEIQYQVQPFFRSISEVYVNADVGYIVGEIPLSTAQRVLSQHTETCFIYFNKV